MLRKIGPGETVHGQRRRGHAKTLRQKDRAGTKLRKVGVNPHAEGATGRAFPGISQAKNGGAYALCCRMRFFVSPRGMRGPLTIFV